MIHNGGQDPSGRGRRGPPGQQAPSTGADAQEDKGDDDGATSSGDAAGVTPAPQEIPRQAGGGVTVIPTGSQEPSDRGRGAPPAQQAPSTKAHAREDEGDDDSATSSKDAAVDDAGAS